MVSSDNNLPLTLAEKPARIVWALAWPAVALNLMQVVNTLLDRGFIGHLESSALTAHGGATNVMFLMFSLAMAVGTAATALVARAYGARDDREYRMASRQSLRLAMVGGVFFCAVCALIAPAAATFVLPADDPAAIRQMVAFVRAYAIGMPAIYLIQTLAGSLRGIGDTKSPMWISGIQILLHITLNFFLIRRFGLVGAAMSLSTSAWLAAIAYLIYQQRTPLGASSLFALPSRDWIQRILRIAAPAAAMAALRVFSLTAFTLILKGVPSASAAIAAMSVGFAIESIMFMPAFGLSMAAGALVGQNLGAKNPARAERLAWVAGHHGAIVTAFVAIPIFLLAHPIAFGLVGGKAVIANNAADLIRALCVTEVLFAYAMIMIGAMQGAGDTKGPMWISIIALWGLRVPLAWIFAIGMKMGAPGAWLSMSATQGVQGIMSIWLFQRGAWKTKRV